MNATVLIVYLRCVSTTTNSTTTTLYIYLTLSLLQTAPPPPPPGVNGIPFSLSNASPSAKRTLSLSRHALAMPRLTIEPANTGVQAAALGRRPVCSILKARILFKNSKVHPLLDSPAFSSPVYRILRQSSELCSRKRQQLKFAKRSIRNNARANVLGQVHESLGRYQQREVPCRAPYLPVDDYSQP